MTGRGRRSGRKWIYIVTKEMEREVCALRGVWISGIDWEHWVVLGVGFENISWCCILYIGRI
jgi:hypothetical protein